jgi:DNA-binding NtrC family response regulator
LTGEFLAYLEDQYWKGNIRELKNIIERAVILSNQDLLCLDDLPYEMLTSPPEKINLSSRFDLASVEKLHIQRILHYTRGNKVEAARLLNIGITTIYRKMETYGIG